MLGHRIGILDSGIGGLSILRHIRQQLPDAELLYIADQAHLPYGVQPLEQVQDYTQHITEYLLAQGAQVIVIACNTASAAALHPMRERFPDVPFVGLEPAVRPAARDTQNGTIGVIATAATFQGKLYASLVERFAEDVTVIKRACPELVTLAERGTPWLPADYDLVQNIMADFRAANIDQLVLGCTHFAFVEPLLAAALGDSVKIIDPAPAVARQTGRILKGLKPTISDNTLHLMTTGDLINFVGQAYSLLGEVVEDAPFRQVVWHGDQLR